MKTIKSLFIIINLFAFTSIFAQDTIIHQNVDEINKVYEKSNYGPNSTHYVFAFQTLNFYTPSVYEDQHSINYFKSIDYYYGMKYVLKIFPWYYNGLSIYYNFQNINFKDQLTSGYSTEMKDKIVMNNFGAEYFWRFSLGKHGKTVGKFIDFGVWGKINANNRYIIKTKDNSSLYSSISQKEVYKNTDLFNKYFYGATFRIGVKQFSFVANYNISDIFTQNTLQTNNVFDLPKLTVGIEIAIVE